ncbi:MAG TPA: serine hydrolase [Clostridia bacterium]|nr:serine hydrolase [Clostridia bacterium]
MRRSSALISTALFLLFLSLRTPAAAQDVPDLRVIDDIVGRSIAAGEIPGAVVVVGHDGEIAWRKAYGSRSLEPAREAMTADTVFDAASLTKCLVTATALMQLVERGQVKLNDPVGRYLPEFARNGKEQITVRQLATHYSGLREDLDLAQPWAGKDTAYRLAFDEKPVAPPGSEFRYSDINFIVLGALIERVTGMSLDAYADKNIFVPLGMSETRFAPPAAWTPRIAPTEYDENRRMLRGVVHDPTARRMGGVAGHAGLFSTADDVAKFAQTMLDGKFVTSAAALEKMTTPQQPANMTVLRGIGWDIDSPFSSNRGELLPVGSFGHTGFTGTSLWSDPATKTFVLLLANAVHPRLQAHPGAPIISLRTRLASAVAAALKLNPSDGAKQRLARITGYNETMAGARSLTTRNGEVRNGIDILAAEGFATLKQLAPGRAVRVGILTNQTGLDLAGRRTIDVVRSTPGVELVAIFSPEHGVAGVLDTTDIANTRDLATGVPVYSVYGAKDEQRRPKQENLRGLDAVIFDVQDAGARWYTYETTLGYFLEACAEAGVRMVVLDRPNPITGATVQGLVSDGDRRSFVNYHPVPVRHGMTVGELATMFNAERGIGAELTVVKMQGWLRGDWFDSTGLTWTNPSPNMRGLTAATLYPGVALVEGTNVSVGRGTDTPFEVLGAPWIDARQFAAYLNARKPAGVRFVPMQFTPASSNYANQVCRGVNIIVTDRNTLDSAELGLELVSALMKLYPEQYNADRLHELLVNRQALEGLKHGDDPRRIAEEQREKLDEFMTVRAKYLLY